MWQKYFDLSSCHKIQTKLEPVTKRSNFELFNPPLHTIRCICLAAFQKLQKSAIQTEGNFSQILIIVP
jgi:hypothetical protein